MAKSKRPPLTLPNPLLNKRQFADYYQVSEGTVDLWVSKGKVTPQRTPGGTPRFKIADDPTKEEEVAAE